MTPAATHPLLIIGCGDIGRRVAARALSSGVSVSALSRSIATTAQLNTLGIVPIAGDLDAIDQPIAQLPTAGANLLYLAPPPGGGETDHRVRVLCGSIEPGQEPRMLVYISTSAVYGDCGGAWVDETTLPTPSSSRGRRRLDAERLLRAWGEHRGVPVVTLRVPGIYGPGRFPFDRLLAGHPVLIESESPWTNLIHADDLARLCLAALNVGTAGEILNVGDGQPLTMTDYFNAVADVFELSRPAQISRSTARAAMTPLMFSYFSESRRLDTRRLREQLAIKLLYPTLASGLAAARNAGISPRQPLGGPTQTN